MVKIVIVTAECGEPQLVLLKENLERQRDIEFVHYIISDKTTLEAELEIYRLFQVFNYQNEFEWFLRLDADMNFTSEESIIKMIKIALEFDNISRLTLPLRDYYTGTQIIGVHLIKLGINLNKVVIHEYTPERWIDKIPGSTKLYLNKDIFTHGFQSDIDQCIRFGLHRGIKALNSGPRGIHWKTIYDLYLNLCSNHMDNNLWITYYSSLIGAGYLIDVPIVWNTVDKNSDNNLMVKNIIFSSINQFKITHQPFAIYKLHYDSYKSIYETCRFIFKMVFLK